MRQFKAMKAESLIHWRRQIAHNTHALTTINMAFGNINAFCRILQRHLLLPEVLCCWSLLACWACFLKILHEVQIHTSTLHVLAEFGKYPLKIAWQAQAAKYLSRLESMDDNRTLEQAFVADCTLPKQKSWTVQLEAQLRDVSVNVPTTDDHSHRCFSIQSAHIAQLSSSTSSRAATYRDVKVGYGCEPYIQQSNNRHLRRIVAQFRTGSHWLNIETGRHKKVDRSGRICPMCVGRITYSDVPADCFDAFDSDEDAPDPIEDEHHAIFECSAYATTRQMFSDLFPSHVSTVSQVLNQPDCNRLAKFWISFGSGCCA